MPYRFTLFIPLLLAACEAALAGEIHLRRECTCSGALVTLEQVADIYTIDAEQRHELAKVELFPPPTDGKTRTVSAREIQDLLAARGVDLRANRLSGASRVVVQGHAPRPDQPTQSAVQTSRAKQPQIQVVNALVTVRPLARGEIVRDEDVQLASLPINTIRGDAAADLRDVVGQQLKRAVGSGQTIQRSALQSPRLVQRNETVTLLVKANGIQVRTFAKALDEGGRNDAIRLQSLIDRNVKYTGRVVGYKEVEILAGAPVVHQPQAPRARPAVQVSPTAGAPLVSSVNQPVAIGPRSPRSPLGLRVQRSDVAPLNR